mmetsp:Transcript_6336/g.8412  ORF Transcript_6336/g.8412 Transcript_6336/m.8412 type:complete len:96 (-) Transcript_6336:64-351(-)
MSTVERSAVAESSVDDLSAVLLTFTISFESALIWRPIRCALWDCALPSDNDVVGANALDGVDVAIRARADKAVENFMFVLCGSICDALTALLTSD